MMTASGGVTGAKLARRNPGLLLRSTGSAVSSRIPLRWTGRAVAPSEGNSWIQLKLIAGRVSMETT
jgi:hypothetical protein